MAQDRQGSASESATGFLQTVGISEPSSPKNGKAFRWTIRRRRFCHNLVRNGGHVGKAALDAGYATRDEGTHLLQLPPIKKYIEIDLRNHLDAETVTEESVVTRWSYWAGVDINDFVEKDRRKGRRYKVRIKNPWNMEERARRCIKKLTVRDLDDGHQEITLELHDAMKANDKLAQMLGLLTPDREQGAIDADATARDIWATIKAMEELDGLTGDSAEQPGQTDRAVDPAPQA